MELKFSMWLTLDDSVTQNKDTLIAAGELLIRGMTKKQLTDLIKFDSMYKEEYGSTRRVG